MESKAAESTAGRQQFVVSRTGGNIRRSSNVDFCDTAPVLCAIFDFIFPFFDCGIYECYCVFSTVLFSCDFVYFRLVLCCSCVPILWGPRKAVAVSFLRTNVR